MVHFKVSVLKLFWTMLQDEQFGTLSPRILLGLDSIWVPGVHRILSGTL